MSDGPVAHGGQADTNIGPKPTIAEVAAWLRRAAEQRDATEDLTSSSRGAIPVGAAVTDKPDASSVTVPSASDEEPIRTAPDRAQGTSTDHEAPPIEPPAGATKAATGEVDEVIAPEQAPAQQAQAVEAQALEAQAAEAHKVEAQDVETLRHEASAGDAPTVEAGQLRQPADHEQSDDRPDVPPPSGRAIGEAFNRRIFVEAPRQVPPDTGPDEPPVSSAIGFAGRSGPATERKGDREAERATVEEVVGTSDPPPVSSPVDAPAERWPDTGGSRTPLFDLDLVTPATGTKPSTAEPTVPTPAPAAGVDEGAEPSAAAPGETTVASVASPTKVEPRPRRTGDTPAAAAFAALMQRRAKRKRYPRGQLKERIGILRRVRAMLGVVVVTVLLGVAAGAAIGAFLVFLAFALRGAITSG